MTFCFFPPMLTVTSSHLRRCLAIVIVASAINIITSPASNASELRRTAIVKAVQQAAPSVVNIHGHKTMPSLPTESGKLSRPRRVNGMGTGVVIDERGYIMTNHHVIDGVRRIQVTLSDRRTYVAKLVAHDPQTDLAIIKISRKQPMPLISIGTSSDLLAGEPVIAVGNAYGYHHTVTRGIISALNRSVQVTDSQHYHDLIQTDASINPGNSGGPLLNIDGDMIGINVAVRVGAQGIGFAIPVDKVIEVARQLMSVEDHNGIWHGIQGHTASKGSQRGFVVQQVKAGSPADAAGIRAGDVVSRIENVDVVFGVDIERALLGHSAGDKVDVSIKRNDENRKLNMVLARNFQRSRSVKRETDAWNLLGMDLSPVSASRFREQNTQYRGGLRVARVRANGPAARQGIQTGDILVGMHKWETVSLDNLDYILSQKEVKGGKPVKFYIMRGEDTLYGHLPVKVR